MSDFEVTSKRKEPSVLDVDWQHENAEPISEHNEFHPTGGSPPSVNTPDSVFDIDFHPDPRSPIEGGYNEYNNQDPNVAVTYTPVQDSELSREAEQLARAQKDLEVAQLKQQVMSLKGQTSAIMRAQRATKESLVF